MLRNASIILIGASIVFGSAACTPTSEPEAPAPSSSVSASPEVKTTESNYLTTLSSAPNDVKDEKEFSENNVIISAVNDEFSVLSYGTGTELTVEGEAVNPAEGEIYHFISYSYNRGGDTEFAVEANGKKIPITNLPSEGVIAVSAPEDADLKILSTLTVGDQPVIQSINPVTGERETTNREVLYKNTVGDVSNAAISGTGGTSPYTLTVNSTVKKADRTDWIDTKRWAPEGQSFVVVTLGNVDYQMEKNGSPDLNAHVVKLVDGSGKEYVGEKINGGMAGDDIYAFSVPLSEDNFELSLDVSTGITMTGKPVASVDGLTTSSAVISF